MSLATAALDSSALTAALEQVAHHLAIAAARAQLDEKRSRVSVAGEERGILLLTPQLSLVSSTWCRASCIAQLLILHLLSHLPIVSISHAVATLQVSANLKQSFEFTKEPFSLDLLEPFTWSRVPFGPVCSLVPSSDWFCLLFQLRLPASWLFRVPPAGSWPGSRSDFTIRKGLSSGGNPWDATRDLLPLTTARLACFLFCGRHIVATRGLY